MSGRNLAGTRRAGFTLVEILVVLAITSILMLLVFGPLVQSFNITRRAQAESEAQQMARGVLDDITAELANATYVRDNTTPEARLEILLPEDFFETPDLPENHRLVPLSFAKLDFYPPSKGDPGNPEYNPYIDKIDPTLVGKAPIGNITLPMARGVSMVRYFIGLRDPFQPYLNKYEQALVRAGRADNLFVLYRAEVVPVLPDGQVNTNLFEVGPDGGPLLDDPYFFTVFQNDPQVKLDRVSNWLAVSRVVVPQERADLIRVIRDAKSGKVVYDADGRPQVLPLLSFQPQRVDDEPASPDNTTVVGEEAPDRIPTGFATQYGGWTDEYGIKLWRESPVSGRDVYWTQGEWVNGTWHRILWHTYPTGGSGTGEEPVFDITLYENGLQVGNPHLESAIMPGLSSEPMALVVDPVSGRVITSLPREHLQDGTPFEPRTGPPLTFLQDPNPDPNTVNGRLNYQYIEHPEWGRRIERFVRLRDDQAGPLARWATASIVPNSEVIYGPDQRPGSNWGTPVRYRRVPSLATEPQPNEYRINYWNLEYDPDQLLRLGFDVNDPDVQMFILPRFEAGYIKFYSDPNYPMPDGLLVINYRFQLNQQHDVLTVDYSTKEVMTVSFGVKRYDTGSGDSHLTTLTNRVHVRNFLR
jgi:prepilin-type N-terminal cleavage/methylation domain-containing protein